MMNTKENKIHRLINIVQKQNEKKQRFTGLNSAYKIQKNNQHKDIQSRHKNKEKVQQN